MDPPHPVATVDTVGEEQMWLGFSKGLHNVNKGGSKQTHHKGKASWWCAGIPLLPSWLHRIIQIF